MEALCSSGTSRVAFGERFLASMVETLAVEIVLAAAESLLRLVSVMGFSSSKTDALVTGSEIINGRLLVAASGRSKAEPVPETKDDGDSEDDDQEDEDDEDGDDPDDGGSDEDASGDEEDDNKGDEKGVDPTANGAGGSEDDDDGDDDDDDEDDDDDDDGDDDGEDEEDEEEEEDDDEEVPEPPTKKRK